MSASEGTTSDVDDRPDVQRLFVNLKALLPTLEKLLEEQADHWGYEDSVYRFYHQSFKLYRLQDSTLCIVEALRSLLPERELNTWFKQILVEGTGKTFERDHNARWLEETRPIIEAFFHAHYFLEVAVRYGRTLEAPPRMLPSGWASLLYLFNLR